MSRWIALAALALLSGCSMLQGGTTAQQEQQANFTAACEQELTGQGYADVQARVTCEMQWAIANSYSRITSAAETTRSRLAEGAIDSTTAESIYRNLQMAKEATDKAAKLLQQQFPLDAQNTLDLAINILTAIEGALK